MSGGVSIHPKGTEFTRLAVALARVKGHIGNAQGYAAANFPSSQAGIILRSVVSPGQVGDPSWAAGISEYRVAARDFLDLVRPGTILGKISGYRRIPARTKVSRATANSSVGWVGSASPIKVSAMALDTVTLENLKLAGIACTSQELVDLASQSADALIRQDLVNSVRYLTDRSLVDPTAAGETGVAPAASLMARPPYRRLEPPKAPSVPTYAHCSAPSRMQA